MWKNISKVAFKDIALAVGVAIVLTSSLTGCAPRINLTARGYHGILKLARTIEDLAGSEDIQSAHLAEALQYPKLMS